MQRAKLNNNKNSLIKFTKCRCKDVMKNGNILRLVVHKYCSKSTVITARDVPLLQNSKLTLSN